MKKMLVVMVAFFAVCGFNYTDLENAVGKEIKENLKTQLEASVKDKGELNSKLFKAARAGNVNDIKNLIKQGADVNARNEYSHTPLMHASFFGHLETCEVLIELGADVNAKDVQNTTALFFAEDASIVDLLIKNKANINAQDTFGRTPLMFALENNNLDSAFALTLYRPNLDLIDYRGSSAVMYLASNGAYAITEPEHYQSEEFLKLYQIGEIFDRVMRRADCSWQNNLGQTALDLATLKGNTLIIKKIENSCK
ncbi:MAG: ankyrin repeat domain-containing protein [Elusimicrobiaceae bacterium]|nr:ankyrin repeat domain-containing protein [Elusimicrobiaceae bacterium]